MKHRDPVCGMEVAEDCPFTVELDGRVYRLCSEGCKRKFIEERAGAGRKSDYDLVVIGGGPAGLTAAVYAATLRLDAFLIARDLGGQAIDSTKIENYMGYDFVTGPELIERFRDQLIHSHHLDHLITEAEQVRVADGAFEVTTSGALTYKATALIVATGMLRRKLGVPGEEEFQRRGIFYGNIQDYSLFRGGDVAVVGGGNSALQMVENLQQVAASIHLVSDAGLSGDPAIAARVSGLPNLERYEHHRVVEFGGGDSIASVTIRELAGKAKTRIPVKGVFVAIGLRPASQLVAELVELNERGEIVIGADCSTTHPGIYAAGDVTDAFGKRIIIASGEGAKAALAARRYLAARGRSNTRAQSLSK